MAQINSGIRSILSSPYIYNAFQNILGARSSRIEFVEHYCKPKTGQRWLDIGCGTAELLKYLPLDIAYVGFDVSETYIQFAKRAYKKRNAKFYTELIADNSLKRLKHFDRIVATGLLHHLDDDEVVQLFKIIKPSLTEGGRFVSIDPCFISGQSFFSKALVKRDRGQNVRYANVYYQLAKSVFENVELTHRNDLLFIPYDHAILICR